MDLIDWGIITIIGVIVGYILGNILAYSSIHIEKEIKWNKFKKENENFLKTHEYAPNDIKIITKIDKDFNVETQNISNGFVYWKEK